MVGGGKAEAGEFGVVPVEESLVGGGGVVEHEAWDLAGLGGESGSRRIWLLVVDQLAMPMLKTVCPSGLEVAELRVCRSRLRRYGKPGSYETNVVQNASDLAGRAGGSVQDLFVDCVEGVEELLAVDGFILLFSQKYPHQDDQK